MNRPSTSLSRARARAEKDGWDASWVRSEVDARAVLDGGCYFDPEAARRVINFFGNVLRHANTATGTIENFSLLDWQRDRLIQPLFGWKRRDGTRRYRRAGVWVPKKNGKSTLAAGLELYMLVADQEPGAEVYSAANDRKQAGIIHGHAVRMVELSPVLMKRITPKGIIRSTKTIYDRQSGSTFMALSADAPTKEGLNIHGLIVDEIHAMKSRVLWDTLVYGGASRRQPLILSISTAGVYDIMSIGWEQYTYARDIATGVKDDDWAFFALLYEAGKDDDWTDPKTHAKANPSYGATVKIDTLQEECIEAQAEPRKEAAFRRYRLNQWTNQSTRWITLDLWDANNAHPIDRAALKGAASYGGLDVGSISDMTAFAVLSQCPHDPDALDVTLRLWIPEETLNDPKNRNADVYRIWHREGFLSTTPGTSTDYDRVEADVIADAQHFNLRGIAIDRLFQGQQIENHLTDAGLAVTAIGMGWVSQAPPLREFERLLLAKKIHHGGHPVLRWMADNVEVKTDADGKPAKIVKPNHHMDPRKVDGIQAVVNAIDPWSRHQNHEPTYQIFFAGGQKRR